ncbi:cyclin-A3-2 isoform X2 [Zea mays]|uniref:Cyclin-like domain-containing protein n=1 Tax=Zea mays TaxID=4577 RepID=A0A804UKD9_MAIZE|nr:uncharacterized protein LOC100280138 isoform X2 [Zea mays]|eukprot:XP_020399222.1 cyclin superfamily protein, putative isoform X2 [Zea mays]
MKRKENSAHSAPPLNRPRGKRKALAELPKSNGLNMNHDSAPRPSKPRTRSAARAEAEAEAAMKRRKAGDAARWPMDTRQPDAEAAVAPYVGDIDRYLRSLEVEPLRRPSHSYFQDIQKNICPKMRAILVDWLVEVAEEFKLHAETLHLAVSYVDRFLTMNVVARNKLQLLGVTALLVAAKYEEIESSKMKVKRYTDITDNTYTKQQVVKMETDLLKSLSFQIGGPTVTTFLRQFIASCRGGNNLSLEQSTGYRVFDLQKSIYVIHELQLTIRCPNQVAIREKYKDPKFGCVSTMVSPREIPTSFLEGCHK